MLQSKLKSKISIAIVLGFVALTILILAEQNDYDRQKQQIQIALDQSLLSAAKYGEDMSMGEFQEMVYRDFQNRVPWSSDHGYWSSAGNNHYRMDLTTLYRPKLPYLRGLAPKLIEINSEIQRPDKPGFLARVIVDLKHKDDSFLENEIAKNSEFFTAPMKDLADPMRSVIPNLLWERGYMMSVIVTDDISAPNLCAILKGTGRDRDLIFIGEKTQDVENIFLKCATPHPLHGCLNNRHIAASQAKALDILKEITNNYGTMRFSC